MLKALFMINFVLKKWLLRGKPLKMSDIEAFFQMVEVISPYPSRAVAIA